MNTKTNILVIQALFLTLFFLASNVLPPIYIIGIPITFQTVIIYLLPYIFSLKQSIFWYFSLLIMTLIGIPMMAGFKSGLVVLFGPSSGFIYGWLIIIVLLNLSLRFINNKYLKYLIMILAIVTSLSLGGLVLSLYSDLGIFENISIILISFLPIELIKLLIVVKITSKIPIRYLNKEI